MPYEVVEVKGGYMVKKKGAGRPVYMSNSPLTKTRAMAQMRAIYSSEARRKGKKDTKQTLKEKANRNY
jgi:hypothetical protein